MTRTASPQQIMNQQPPGPRGHLLLGSLFDIHRDLLGFMRSVTSRYVDIARY